MDAVVNEEEESCRVTNGRDELCDVYQLATEADWVKGRQFN